MKKYNNYCAKPGDGRYKMLFFAIFVAFAGLFPILSC